MCIRSVHGFLSVTESMQEGMFKPIVILEIYVLAGRQTETDRQTERHQARIDVDRRRQTLQM